jgi:chromosome segregation ATPase
MKDDATKIFTGILIHSEIQRKNAEKSREQDDENDRLNEKNKRLEDEKNKSKKQNQALQNESDDLEHEVDILQAQNRALYNKAVELQEEVDDYKRLLCKPMAEIADKNANFKDTYEKQMQLMAEWMVSQKAFKELAIQFGVEKGLSPDEVIEQGTEKRLDVLENKNDESHNTNIQGSSVVTPERAEKMKEKIKNK